VNKSVEDSQEQQPIQSQVPDQQAPQSFESQKSFPKWPLIIAVIILITILLIGAYALNKNQSAKQKLATQTTQTPTPTKMPNSLNPNTGNLYSDIKVRLNEVLK
jgi:flagellar basal body-associated protein FliL